MRVSRRLFRSSFFALILGGTLAVHGQAPPSRPTLTLEEAVALGLAHHPAAGMAIANQALAKAGVTSARTSFLPTVTASEEATVSNDPVFAFGTKLRQARFASSDFGLDALNHPSPIGNFDSSATAQWTAFDSFATQRQIRSAREAASAAELNRRYTDQQIADSVTTLYYRALLAEAQIATAEANRTKSTEIASDIRDRVRSGLALEADGMKADLAVRMAEDDLAAARSNAQVARGDLFDAVGETVTDVLLAAPVVDATPFPDNPIPARLDLQALDLQKASARTNLSSIRATAGPKLSTFAHVESDNPHLTGGGSGNWTVGAKLEISVFDGGARKAREQEAAAQIAKIDATKAQTELAANQRIRTLRSQMDDLERRRATADTAIKTDEEALKASRDRYAAGLASVSDVLGNEAGLSAAQFDRLRAQYQLLIVRSQLQFANGTLTTPKAGLQ